MPQLDKVTFLGQFFWTTLFFFSLYFLFLKLFLPQLSRILKYRGKKYNSHSHQSGSLLSKEIFLIRTTCEKLLSTTVEQGITIFKNVVFALTNWVKGGSHEIDEREYKKPNQNYLKGLGEISCSEKIPYSQPFQPSPYFGGILEIIFIFKN
jgi:hypothetical protein